MKSRTVDGKDMRSGISKAEKNSAQRKKCTRIFRTAKFFMYSGIPFNTGTPWNALEQLGTKGSYPAILLLLLRFKLSLHEARGERNVRA